MNDIEKQMMEAVFGESNNKTLDNMFICLTEMYGEDVVVLIKEGIKINNSDIEDWSF